MPHGGLFWPCRLGVLSDILLAWGNRRSGGAIPRCCFRILKAGEGTRQHSNSSKTRFAFIRGSVRNADSFSSQGMHRFYHGF